MAFPNRSAIKCRTGFLWQSVCVQYNEGIG
jgi:hypothetical protein